MCATALPVYDHVPERAWRHLDTCDYQTWCHARLPRVCCPQHGILQAKAPLSDGSARQTCAMERRCIDTLAECSREGAAKLTGLSWDEMDGVMERSVERGMARRPPELPTQLGIDEKCVFARHKYVTILADLAEGTVTDVLDKRTIDAIKPWFAERKDQLGAVERVAMDMSAGYANVITEMIPDAEICYDHFHVTAKVTGAVDAVRKLEQAEMNQGEERTEFFRARFLFLYNQENVPERRVEQFQKLKATAIKTSRAWAIKEQFRELWNCQSEEEAEAFFKQWYWWATHCRLEPMRKVAHTIKNHWQGIVNAIVHKVTNACTEGLNNKIEKIKRDAFGFRNKAKLRIAILFHCGGLDLYPAIL